MAIQCQREGTADVWWQQWLWPKLLRLALQHGWEPQGTSQPPDRLKWFPDGWDPQNYSTNDLQLVSAEDARALADALTTALLHLADDDALAPHRLPDGNIELAPNPPKVPDAAWFSGPEQKVRIREFVAFCRGGGFRIA